MRHAKCYSCICHTRVPVFALMDYPTTKAVNIISVILVYFVER